MLVIFAPSIEAQYCAQKFKMLKKKKKKTLKKSSVTVVELTFIFI